MERRVIIPMALFVAGLMVGALLSYILTPHPDIKALNLQIEQLQEEVSNLQSALSEKENKISSLSAQLEEISEERANLEKKLSDLEEEIDGLSKQVIKLNDEKEVLEEKIFELRSKMNVTLIAVSFSRTEDTGSLLQYWIDRANNTIYVMVMCITQDELADALIEAHNRGVDVKVIIDDDWLYASGSDYETLLTAGIDIRGDNREGLMHHKVMIIDGCIVVTGSYNWSWSAENNNDENVLILRSSKIAQEYLEEFNRIWEGTVKPTGEEGGSEEEITTIHVVINEVELNPPGVDAGNEWIELYNPTDQTIDLSDWTIFTTHGVTVTLTIEEGTIIKPKGYLVLSYWDQWLDNEDESIILRDVSGNVIDSTPILSDMDNDNRTWSRYPNGYDTDSASDWVFRPSTKGYENQ